MGISYCSRGLVVSADGGVALNGIFVASFSTGLKEDVISTALRVVSFCAMAGKAASVRRTTGRDMFLTFFIVFIYRKSGLTKLKISLSKILSTNLTVPAFLLRYLRKLCLGLGFNSRIYSVINDALESCLGIEIIFLFEINITQ